MFESDVTWATSVPILVFLDLSVLSDLGPMYATDVRRQTDRRQTKALRNAPLAGT